MTDNQIIYVSCPHCKDLVEINILEINCAIFRHGILKKIWNKLTLMHVKKSVII